MRMRLPVPALILVAVLGGACSEGDLISLTPPGAPCVWPGDPDWSPLLPADDFPHLNDIVQVDGNLAVAVGDGGRALVRVDGQWAAEETGTDAMLIAVAVLGDQVVAVGGEGTIACRDANGWRVRQVADTGSLYDVCVAGDTLWAVGFDDALVAVFADGAEAMPVSSAYLTGAAAARGDSLFISGPGSEIHVRVAGRWSVLPCPLPAGALIRDLGHLPDGRLIVSGTSFIQFTEYFMYIREPAGWREVGSDVFDHRVYGFKSATDVLWLETPGSPYSTHDALDWAILDLGGSANQVRVAPLADAPLLAVNAGRELLTVLPDGTIIRDPASNDYLLQTFTLSDGTVGYVSAFGIHRVTASGDATVATIAPGSSVGVSLTGVAGSGLAEMYVQSSETIYRYRDGAFTALASCDTCGFNSMVALPGGRVLVGAASAVFELTPQGLESIYRDDDMYELLVLSSSPNGDLLVVSQRKTLLARSGGDLAAFGLAVGGRHGGFLPDGRAVVVAKNPVLDDGTRGDGAWCLVVDGGPDRDLSVYNIDKLADCPNMNISGCVSTAGGLFVWTAGPNLVYRLDGEPAYGDWSLVAGPFEYEIDRIEVLADGGILAAAVSERLLYLHPGNRP